MKPIALVLAIVTIAAPVSAQKTGTFPFVLPWDDATKTLTNMRSLNHRPAGKYGFVRAKGGHLVTDSGRIRFLGVNICMDACFPEHADAGKVAARMAKFGINCVRFHHMDADPAPRGILQADLRTLDPGQLDRLDYFIAQLKANGIYTDLNLHVSRKYPGQPTWEGMPSFFKGLDNFETKTLRLQREYAWALLTHTNPYTRSRYASEPAVAFIEINNENGLLQIWGNGDLDRMPVAYQHQLSGRWNAWLLARYPKPALLRKAWDCADVPFGEELLKDTPMAWTMEQHEKAVSIHESGGFGPNGDAAHRIRVVEHGEQGWHVQFNQAGIVLAAGKPCTFSFQARADAPRSISVSAMQAHAPWANLWSEQVELDTQWKEFKFVFRPSASDVNARIGFGEMGSIIGEYEFARLTLKPGGSSPALRNAVPGGVAWFPHKGFSSLPTEARRDWIRFLWDTEVTYWTGMYKYIRTDLKARAPIIGTQVSNSPEIIQAKMDVVDNHAYWKHPDFPNRPWDSEDWTVENVPMSGDATAGTLPALAWRRAAGKPYVVTEYNHPAPNSFGAEMMPILCAYAALQDWDGVFAFDYCSNRSLWASGRIAGFFSIGNHPTKMATFPAAAAMFLRADVKAARVEMLRPLTTPASQARIGAAGRYDAWGTPESVDPLDVLRHRTGWALSPVPVSKALSASAMSVTPVRSDTGELAWAKTVTVDTPRTKAAVGPIPETGVALGGIRIAGDGQPAVVALTVVAGKSFRGPCRILLTAAGDARNTGMRWKDSARNSVGSNWGTAPSVVDGVRATITIPISAGRVHAWALDERGARAHELSVAGGGADATISVGPEHKALWYEIVVD